MENKSHALIAGLFTIALGIALALAALWLSRDRSEQVPFELVTSNSIAGLTPQAEVRYRGLAVGTVEKIGFDPKVPGQILVRISVAKGTPVTRSTFATLGYQGLTGLAYVQLDDEGKSTELLESKPGAVARLTIQPGLLEIAAKRAQDFLIQAEQVAQRLNTMLDGANQKRLTDVLDSMSGAAQQIGKVGERLEPTLARLPGLVTQAQKSMEGLPTLVTEAQKTLESLPPLVTDAQRTMAGIGAASKDFAALTARLQEKGGALEQATASLDKLAEAGSALMLDTLPRVNRFADTATSSARSLSRMTDMLGERPQSLLFGGGGIAPGPGESGYVPAPGAAK